MTRIALALVVLLLTHCGPASTDPGGTKPDGSSSGPTCTTLTTDGALLGCPGAFGGAVRPTCPAGYAACKSLPATSAAAQACGKDFGGFFAADLTAYGSGGTETCQPRGTVDAYGLYGCGTKAARGSVLGGDPCGGFSAFLWCNASSGWTCPAGSLAQTTNTNTTDGVLCCKS